MKIRLSKVNRILKVQEQLHRMEEWKLISLQRREVELQETQQALINSLNDDQSLQGLFIASTARQLQRLAVETTQIQEAKEAQAKVTFEQAMQMKRTERMIDSISVEARRSEEKKDYLSLLDVIATGRDASLP